MPLPLTVSCFSKIQIGFSFLVPAHLGSPGKVPLNGCLLAYHYASLRPICRRRIQTILLRWGEVGQASYFLGTESGVGVLGEGQPAPSPPAMVFGGALEAPQAGSGAESLPVKGFLAL